MGKWMGERPEDYLNNGLPLNMYDNEEDDEDYGDDEIDEDDYNNFDDYDEDYDNFEDDDDESEDDDELQDEESNEDESEDEDSEDDSDDPKKKKDKKSDDGTAKGTKSSPKGQSGMSGGSGPSGAGGMTGPKGMPGGAGASAGSAGASAGAGAKAGAKGGAALLKNPVVLKILLIVLAVVLLILLIVGIAVLIASLFTGVDEDVNEKGMASLEGIKGDKFYGVRLVYKDDEESSVIIYKDYATIVATLVDELETSVETQMNDKVPNANVNVEISIGEGEFGKLAGSENSEESEEFDYKTLIDGTFSEQEIDANTKTELQNLKGITDELVEFVYKFDNAEGTETELNNKLKAIKYFGFNEAMNLPMGISITNLISNYIQKQTTEGVYDFLSVSYFDGTETKTTQNASEINGLVSGVLGSTETVDSLTDSFVLDFFDDETYKTRTEKLIIQDKNLASDKMIEGIKAKNYVAMIYMPKTDVSMTLNNYRCLNIPEDFEIDLMQNGVSLGDMTVLDDSDYAEKGENKLTTFEIQKPILLTKYEYVDESNLEQFKDATSLLDFNVKMSELGFNLMNETTDDEGEKIKSLNILEGLVLRFNSSTPFMFAEGIITYN
ncbi:MAG: hypothetical protein E7374_00515 [Clostridiales bacterium]|nr:hypothetical protein [Clostridiales bacterium]